MCPVGGGKVEAAQGLCTGAVGSPVLVARRLCRAVGLGLRQYLSSQLTSSPALPCYLALLPAWSSLQSCGYLSSTGSAHLSFPLLISPTMSCSLLTLLILWLDLVRSLESPSGLGPAYALGLPKFYLLRLFKSSALVGFY